MPSRDIAGLFQVQARFLRSVHLERDFADPHALNGYVLTPQIAAFAMRLASGLRPGSGQRAWRITGDYGSGKSSFALFLAHLLSDRHASLSPRLRQAIDFRRLGVVRPKLLPILVTGAAEPLGTAILRSLHRDLLSASGGGRLPNIVREISSVLAHSSGTAVDDEVVRLLRSAASYIVNAKRGSGILLVLDELGKFLEYGSLHPEQQDIYLLQKLAEAAARSRKEFLFVVGLLHQGFSSYSESLSQSAQREWEKVAARFDEILFNQPLGDMAALIADALQVRTRRLPSRILREAHRDMEAACALGSYGGGASPQRLAEAAPHLYPLHPTVLPVLLRILSRFGQNERSLFSFLLSEEPFGLQEFARLPLDKEQFYRIHNLYDYARFAFGHRLGLQSFRTHWNHIESLVESFHGNDELELEVMKTVGLLNILDTGNLLPNDRFVQLAVVGQDPDRVQQVKSAIRTLRDKRVLYHRGVAGGYCLWPHTSVNLDKAYEDATHELGQVPPRVAGTIKRYLDIRPIVPRRHYIETGNLRQFGVTYSPVEDLASYLSVDFDLIDGRVLVAMCETEEERRQALHFAQDPTLRDKPEILVGVPHPLRILGRLVQELQRWEWVATNTPELNNDPFAAEEVSRQVSAAQRTLEQRIDSVIGMQQSSGHTNLQWFHRAKGVDLSSGRKFLSFVSQVCDEMYCDAPKVANELVNRRSLSSAAAAARMRLIESLFSASSKPYLGMDPRRKPPEMSIYLSLIKETGIHRESEGVWSLCFPPANDDTCRLRPALARILQMVEQGEINRIKVAEVFSELRKPPFGVRDGLNPILLAVFAVVHEQHIAFYENGRFMQEMAGLDLMRLTKLPHSFEIQFCRLAGVRSELYERLLEVLGSRPLRSRRPDILDVVRPLCVFAAQLSQYAKNTQRVSHTARAVRSVLLEAREPASLLFRQLPEACGFRAFGPSRRKRTGEIDLFVLSLKAAIDELKVIHPNLQERIKKELLETFGIATDFANARKSLADRAKAVADSVTEPHLRGFVNRMRDLELSDGEWLESLGSLLCSSPPSRWSDIDEERFSQEIRQLAARLCRVECFGFGATSATLDSNALRICVTQRDGSEVDRVVHFGLADEEEISKAEQRIREILETRGDLGLAAGARAFWAALKTDLERQ